MLTFSELIEELYNVDEVTLVETLGLTAEDIVNKLDNYYIEILEEEAIKEVA